MSVVLLVLGLILFVGLVVVHEFGHFLAARRNGVDVEEFGVGFPPRAWSKKTKGGFIFSLNWLPIGGFVKLKGESDAATEKGTLGAASTAAKAKIMLAGVTMNLIVAFLLLTVLGWIGMPQLIDNQFTIKNETTVLKSQVLAGYVEAGSPATKSGLQARDEIQTISYAGRTERLKSAAELPQVTEKFAGKTVEIGYVHSGHLKTTSVHLRDQQTVEASKKTDKPKGYLGVSPTEYKTTRSTWSAPITAAGLIWQFTVATFHGLGTAIAAVFQGQG